MSGDDASERPGPAARYDGGEIQTRIIAGDRTVVIDFGTAVTRIGLAPNDARDLANMLVECAARVDRAIGKAGRR